jgi:hypothetical protein
VAGPWVSEVDVKQAVADTIKKDVSALAAYWDRIVSRSVNRAYTDLRNFLIGRGFTAAQLDAWDDNRQYNLDQALYFSYVEGAGPEDQTDRDMRRFDRVSALMKEEDPLTLMISGVLQGPGAGEGSTSIGGGSITQAADGVDYGNVFGTRAGRQGGYNQYGDQTDSW